jgi:signal transduction histidine kinase
VVEDPEDVLIQKTDRTGFVESDTFLELRRFAIDTLEWLADKRVEERDEARQQQRTEASKQVARAKQSLSKTLESLSPKPRSTIKKAVDRLEKAVDRERKALQSEIQLYRTLSTVGTTFAVFSHEVEGPSRRIRKLAEGIERRARENLGEEKYTNILQVPVDSILRSADELSVFPRLGLSLLERDKRRIEPMPIHSAITGLVELFKPFLERFKVEIKCEFADAEPVITGSIAAVESIVANLLTNSFNAFTSDQSGLKSREIVVRTSISKGKTLVLSVLDNGPGIRRIGVNEIWLPGRTTLPDGTGLGLTIVRDTVADLGGLHRAIAKSELGGAEIILEIPLQGAD